MQDRAVLAEMRFNGIGRPEIGGSADRGEIEVMLGLALRGRFLSRQRCGHCTSEPERLHFRTTSPTTGFAEPL